MRAKRIKKTLNNNTESSAELKSPKHKSKLNILSKIKTIRSDMDMPFLFLVITILVIGLIMMFSASYPYAFYHNKDAFHFIKSQLVFAILGVTAMFFVSYVDYTSLHKLAVPLIITSFVLLAVVLVMPPMNGVHRWIRIGSFSFQASEITKFAIILSFSHFISLNLSRMHTFRYGILPYLLILAPTIVLLAMEPHISCSVIVVLLAAGMLFIGGIKLKWLEWCLEL